MIKAISIDTLVNRYYEKVKRFVMRSKTISLYEIDREFQVGHVVAAYIIDRLENEGVIAPYETCMPRKVLLRK
ncbi:DNA translocase FtsK [Bacillus cereus group sp. Bce041]|uniref:DNA translocase FtsK n=1 Tax=Bacillus cereus group sp. Bce041 TaxID=3445228 RepID=UPI0040415E69